jgi:D-alanyl-D-alanine carboxypeptidase/D-alanyl-D-alanine-endopeptidase (penicillin-binding protein 4)
VKKNLIFSILILGLFFFTACANDAGEELGPAAPQLPTGPSIITRPTQQDVILARDLPFRNDQRISYCEVLSSNDSTYSGYRDQKVYPLASLSKLITTAWALKKLGPDYKFKATWYLKPIGQGVFDAYLKTGYDPVFNIEKILYSLSLLKAQGVQKIRTLIIDESTRVYLSVLSQPHIELETVPISSSETISNLKLILNSNNWSEQTQAARENLTTWAADKNRTLNIPSSFTAEDVVMKNSEEINLSQYPQKVEIASSSLLKYLKNLNVYSNNYMSDAIFQFLGGRNAFKKFQNEDLKISAQQLIIQTGSGLADMSSGVRQDNVGSCYAMISVLKFIDQLADRNNLNLGHLLYNPASDLDGTFTSNIEFSNQVVFKTGRLFDNPAFNLAGIVATKKGSLYFTFLGHDFAETDADQIEKQRNTIFQSALNYYPTQNKYLSMKEYLIFISDI